MPENRIETRIERGLFASRWLLLPIYVGLAVSLAMLVVIFVRELVTVLPQALFMSPDDGILEILTLIDLSLAGNLVVIVLFSGYETFVSRLNVRNEADRPDWMGTVDFAGMKLKLIASIVAISGIHLLKVFMALGENSTHPPDMEALKWMALIHLVFVTSGVLLALMDWLTSKSGAH